MTHESFINKLKTIGNRLQLQHLIAFLLVRLIVIAFHGDKVACAAVGEGIRHEGASHEVILDAPHASHLHGITRRKVLDIGHQRRHKLGLGGREAT